jgi:hypothetical protein
LVGAGLLCCFWRDACGGFRAALAEVRKAFFSEEKKQKTSILAAGQP